MLTTFYNYVFHKDIKKTYIYKLKDLQKLINVDTADPSVLRIVPLEANYVIKQWLSLLYTYKNVFVKNECQLFDHLNLVGVTDNFSLKLSKEDAKLLDSFYPVI